MVTAEWTMMQPADDAQIECAAGSECCYPQSNGRPGFAFGYWKFNSINIRACSRKCAEKVAFHINRRFRSLGSKPEYTKLSPMDGK